MLAGRSNHVVSYAGGAASCMHKLGVPSAKFNYIRQNNKKLSSYIQTALRMLVVNVIVEVQPEWPRVYHRNNFLCACLFVFNGTIIRKLKLFFF